MQIRLSTFVVLGVIGAAWFWKPWVSFLVLFLWLSMVWVSMKGRGIDGAEEAAAEIEFLTSRLKEEVCRPQL